MKISLGIVLGDLRTTNGFGYAGYNIVLSLQQLGHQVPFKDPTAPVEIYFSHPTWYDFSSKDSYHIGYSPWESSEIPDGWVDYMNACDEIWTPSPLIAQWFEEAGTKPVKVYQHGVEPIWAPQRRIAGSKIKFLHMGEPAPRKGGELAVEAFRAAFGNSKDVHLTIKADQESLIRVKNRGGSIVGLPHEIYPNVSLITRRMELEELVALFYSHDVLIYPSFGEGFGLIPLQALATGMITVCTEAWAPYKDFLLDECKLSSTPGPSPWSHMHPGTVFYPNKSHLVEILRNIANNFDKYSGRSYKNSFAVHQKYNWVNLTKEAFAPIVEKFS